LAMRLEHEHLPYIPDFLVGALWKNGMPKSVQSFRSWKCLKLSIQFTAMLWFISKVAHLIHNTIHICTRESLGINEHRQYFNCVCHLPYSPSWWRLLASAISGSYLEHTW
jgi:hypothetical protein